MELKSDCFDLAMTISSVRRVILRASMITMIMIFYNCLLLLLLSSVLYKWRQREQKKTNKMSLTIKINLSSLVAIVIMVTVRNFVSQSRVNQTLLIMSTRNLSFFLFFVWIICCVRIFFSFNCFNSGLQCCCSCC